MTFERRIAGCIIPVFRVLLLLTFLSPACRLWSQEVPGGFISDTPLWRRALGGRIDAFPAQGPAGDVYVVADDRALHSINPETGDSNWIYRPGGRLRNLLLVSPDGTIYVQNDRQELFAVTPGGTGRWKLNMRLEPAALPAAAPDGRLVLPLVGGRIVGVSRHGRILWTVDESAEASAGPVVRSDGTAWIPLSDGRIIALDRFGGLTAEISGSGAVSLMALDGMDRIWAGGFDGRVRLFDPDGGDPGDADADDAGSDTDGLEALFTLRPSNSRVASILTGPEGDALVFMADGTTVEVTPHGESFPRERIAVSGGAPSAGVDGTVFLPASDGSIRVVPREGDTVVLSAPSVLAEPLLTREGILITGGGDWILYGWQAMPPGEGWRQFRGDSRRSGTFPAALPEPDRSEARRDVGFFYREKMALSDDVSERLALLEELESYADGQALFTAMPWAELLIEDLVEVGTVRMVNRHDEPLKSHAIARARAYVLLGRQDDFRSRALLLSCLAKEEDPAALASGFRALGYIGTDWDGASLRLMAARFRSMSPVGERLVLETARALSDLVRYNGDLSDPAGYDLMNELLKSPVSESARKEVMDIIRAVASL